MQKRQISVKQLAVGMFIDELDVSWMKSPFLRHRRKITDPKDIVLIRKAGIQNITIDLSKGIDVSDIVVPTPTVTEIPVAPMQALAKEDIVEKNIVEQVIEVASEPENKPVSMQQELESAKKIQGEIHALVKKLNTLVKEGGRVSPEIIAPVVGDCVESLKRNDQALLTLLHVPRSLAKLEEHSSAVLSLVLSLALSMKYSEADTQTLGMAALLHDCGWVKLPQNLFAKKKAYSLSEKRLIQQHISIVQTTLLNHSDIPEPVKQLVTQHHEAPDGKGYPKAIKRESFTPLLELLQICDEYDELLHGLQDKPNAIPTKVLKTLYQKTKDGVYPGSLFTSLVNAVGVYPLTSTVKLNNGEVARVIELNRQHKLLPKIEILYDPAGKVYPEPILLDLQQEATSVRHIAAVIHP